MKKNKKILNFINISFKKFWNTKILKRELTERGLKELKYCLKVIDSNYEGITMTELWFEKDLQEIIEDTGINRVQAAAIKAQSLLTFATKKQIKKLEEEWEEI